MNNSIAFSIIIVIVLIFLFFLAFKYAKQAEYEYYTNNANNNNSLMGKIKELVNATKNLKEPTDEEKAAAATFLNGLLKTDKFTAEDMTLKNLPNLLLNLNN